MNIVDLGLNLKKKKSIEDLHDLVKEINDIKCCQGVIPSSKIKTFGPQYIESYGSWRHIKCLTLLDNTDMYIPY